ncbi:hypothetical protein KA107_02095 [Candidatus Pacearchaeota archaeon]|nr:hypothetical protein [Candidatus Pacearchaeota archaeon]
MAKKESVFDLSAFIAWVTGILVSLAVGSGMISQTLAVPYIPAIITVIAGWIVVIGAIISVILALFKR